MTSISRGLDMSGSADAEVARRFMSNVDVLGECWSWIRTRDAGGYGAMSIAGITYAAHVISYAIFSGPVPGGMLVCHHCDNPTCVRPDHLFLGTYADNARDAIRKGRHSSVRRVRHAPIPRPATPVAGHLPRRWGPTADSDAALLAIMHASARPLLLHEIASHPDWTWTRRTASAGLLRLASKGLVVKSGIHWRAATSSI